LQWGLFADTEERVAEFADLAATAIAAASSVTCATVPNNGWSRWG
jgi:hypothetical protein